MPTSTERPFDTTILYQHIGSVVMEMWKLEHALGQALAKIAELEKPREAE